MEKLFRTENLFPLESSWIVALLAGVLAIFMIWQLARSLPAQNIVLIVVSLLAVEGLIDWLLVRYGWTELESPAWTFFAGAALLWTAVILGCRKLAQFILEPWRREKYFGVWVLAISGIFVGASQFGWPCFNPEPIDVGRAAILALIRGVTAMAFLACLTPWLIRKRPTSRKKRSELAQQPENKAQESTEQQASHQREVEAGVSPAVMDVAGQPAQPAAPQTAPEQQPGSSQNHPNDH